MENLQQSAINQSESFIMIPLGKLHPDPHPLRHGLDQQHVQDLIDSLDLLRMGPLEALVVMPLHPETLKSRMQKQTSGINPEESLYQGHYQIISGNHRLEALKQSGRTEALCHSIHPDSPAEEFLMKLHLNTTRKKLNPLELCEAMAREKRIYEIFYNKVRQERVREARKKRYANLLIKHHMALNHIVQNSGLQKQPSKNQETGKQPLQNQTPINPASQNQSQQENAKILRSSDNKVYNAFYRPQTLAYCVFKAKELGATPSKIRQDVKIGELLQQIPELKHANATKQEIYSLRNKAPEVRQSIRVELQKTSNKPGKWQQMIHPLIQKQKEHCAHYSQRQLKSFLHLLVGGLNWTVECSFQSLLQLEERKTLLHISELAKQEHDRLKQANDERRQKYMNRT